MKGVFKVGFPSLATPLVNPQSGVLSSPWIQFFQSLLNPPAPIQSIAPTGSPFEYTASSNGSICVEGGTVSFIQITRGTTTFTTGVISGILPMSKGDKITITYTIAPNINFIPG